ncbi:Digeranylgeranylglycerophospholipid reductase [uncultured archaeon]|nr:Digeranylgeranylglycerophospholipid reductase [uncultured archaeon]
MAYDFDVIVVGCGPAGAMAAKAAAKAGCSVAAFDKRKELGAPVRCGEGIGLHWMEELGSKLRPKAISAEINGSVLISPDWKRKVEIRNAETKGVVVDRKVFDKDLALDAGRAGTKIFAHSEVVDVVKDGAKISGVKAFVDGKLEEFRAKVVIAADGGESTIGRLAGLNTVSTLYDTDFGVEYEMVNVECEDLIEVYFSVADAPRGYVWVFPKGKDVANVGVGIGGLNTPNAKYYLDKWLKVHPERFGKATTVAMKGGIIPVGAPMTDGAVGEGIIVAGTAAHQVDPIHGGGICLAMEAGKIAGEVAAKNALAGTTDRQHLLEYARIYEKGPAVKLLKRLKMRKVLEKLSDDDLNAIFAHLDDKDIDNLLKSNFKAVVAKMGTLLITRPGLVKTISALA